MYTGVVSFDEGKYVCKTCAKKIRTKHVPCQAVINKLQITNLASTFCDILILEENTCFKMAPIQESCNNAKTSVTKD